MAQNRTQAEIDSIISQKIGTKNQPGSILPLDVDDTLKEINFNLYNGQASSPRILNINVQTTYASKDHRGSMIIMNPSSVITWQFPTGLNNRDSLTIWNINPTNRVDLKTITGRIYNLVDGERVDAIEPAGRAFVFKQATGQDFYAFGEGLSFRGTLSINTNFPRVNNTTASGGTFQISLNKNATVWYMGVPAGTTPAPSVGDIKLQTGGVFGGTNLSATANTVLSNAFTGATALANYDIHVVAESGVENVVTVFQWQAGQTPSVGDIMVRGTPVVKKYLDAGFTQEIIGSNAETTFSFTLDMPSNSVLFACRFFRGGVGKPTSTCSIGGVPIAKIASLESPTGVPTYIDCFQLLKEQAPANGTQECYMFGPNINQESELVMIIVIEEAAQSILTADKIKAFAGGNIGTTDHQHSFTGLPTSYMLINAGICRDNPDDTIFMNVPGDQNIIFQGLDTGTVSSVASWKKGSSGTNDMEVINGEPEKYCHLALQINALGL